MPNLLGQAITINRKTVRNRIVMPPMVCFNWGDGHGFETVDRAEHYGRRARGGVGLIVVEATAINREGRLHVSQLGLWSDDQVDQFARVATACHDGNAVVLVQLVHAGSKAIGPKLYSASSSVDGDKPIQAMEPEHIERVKQDFVQASLRAQAAGLDGVEVHGAHGYLLNQFTASRSNARTDGYGGTLAGRSRLALETVQAGRAALGPDFIIGYRFGANDPSLAEDGWLLDRLVAAGVDWFNISTGIGVESIVPPADFPEHYITWLGCALHAQRRRAGQIGRPTACVYGLVQPAQAERLLAGGQTDLVAIGRGLLADPDWANKALAGQAVNPCRHCKNGCAFRLDGRSCPVFGLSRAAATPA